MSASQLEYFVVYCCYEYEIDITRDAPPDDGDSIIKPIGEQLWVFQQTKNRSGDAIRGVAAMFANQLGFTFDKIPESEKKAITRFLSRAKFVKEAKKRGKRYGV